MQCEDARDRLLDADVEPHLAECAACRHEAEQLRRTWSRLGTLPAAEPDTGALRSRLEALITSHQPQRRSRDWLRVAALLTVFAAGAAAGALVGRTAGSDPGLTALRGELDQVRTLLTLSLLQQAAAADRLHGVQNAASLVRTQPEVVSALLDALRRDPDVNVRLASIRALAAAGGEAAVREGVVSALVYEDSPLVSIALMDFVVTTGLPPAVPALRRVAADPERDEAVRKAAEDAIASLTKRSL
jgi:hypothetical protein